jgi:hemolysin activation/secretion protein
VTLPQGDVRDRPLTVTYASTYQPQWGTLSFNLEYDNNMHGGANNDTVAYMSNRIGATQDFQVFRAGYTLVAPIAAGWSMGARMSAQYSPDALIPGEQFGLGGANSVRGIDERAITGDTGMETSLEVYTPDIGYNTRLLAFTDSGFVTRWDPQPGETAKDGIQSVGVGLRWTYKEAAAFALDYGLVTRGAIYPAIPTGSTRWHANLLMRF